MPDQCCTIYQRLHTPRKARVQIPQSISVLDYIIPVDISVAVHDLVCVPLGKSRKVGVVLALNEDSVQSIDESNNKKIKYREIICSYGHIPSLLASHLRYLDWLGDYYMVPRGKAYRLGFRPDEAFYQPISIPCGYRVHPIPTQIILTQKQQNLYDAINQSNGRLERPKILHISQTSRTQWVGLESKNLIYSVAIRNQDKDFSSLQLPKLNEQQQQAYVKMKTLVFEETQETQETAGGKNNAAKVHLLDGATGSGKTEVYFHLIADSLMKGQQVVVLLPEVSLLMDWQRRFLNRFGFSAPSWHNGTSAKVRQRLLQQVALGTCPILVGARSALHLPFHNLGLIILDEEHDFSFKQEDGIPYHARDMAVKRGQILNIPVILASATPSLESFENVRRGKYQHVRLTQRHQNAQLPRIHLIDLKKNRPKTGSWLSPPLQEALSQILERKEQGILFLNRRGFAPLMICRACGHRFDCPHCDISLTEHLYPKRKLICHHCHYQMPIPRICPDCMLEGHLASSGPGVERITENLQEIFPKIRIFTATADTLQSTEAIHEFLQRMENHDIDVIVGTQIIAKGLDFPKLTFAGILDADQALFGSNPRAGEQTWQLLQQIAGRTGRREIQGNAYLQTLDPESILFQSLVNRDREKFIENIRHQRQLAHLPPFGRMIALIIQSHHASVGQAYAQDLVQSSPVGHYRILGPLPAPIARLRKWYRFRILLMSNKNIPLQPIVRAMLEKHPTPQNIRLKIDVDPYQFL